MGSPLSPLLCDIFMEMLENEVMKSTDVTVPVLWKRYVDDTFCIWDGTDDELTAFVAKLNDYHPNIKFTWELAKDNYLPFLDVLCKRTGEQIITSVYR